MLALILASGVWLSFPNPKIPNQTITISDGFEMADPVLSPRERIADQVFQGNPGLGAPRQPFSYEAVEEQFPLREVMPARQPMSTEDMMALEDYRTRRLGQDVAIRGQVLNQRVTRNNLDYDNKIITQAEEAMPLLGRLKPGAEDFDAQVADLQGQYPLAFQNQAFTSQINRLANTHNELEQNMQVRMQHGVATDERENYARNRLEENLKTRVAQFGEPAMKLYQQAIEEDMANNRDPDPIAAFARASSAINQAQNQQRQEQPMTPVQVNRARIDLINAKNRILDRKKDLAYQWSDSDQQDLDVIQSEISALGGNTQADPSSTPTQAKTPPNLSSAEGKVIIQNGKRFRVTNGKPVPIE